VRYLPTRKGFAAWSQSRKPEKLQALEHDFDKIRNQMTKDAKKASKLEQKHKIRTAGYVKHNQRLRQDGNKLLVELGDARLQLDCFLRLRVIERKALPARVHEVQEQFDFQQERENVLQAKYAALLSEYDSLYQEWQRISPQE